MKKIIIIVSIISVLGMQAAKAQEYTKNTVNVGYGLGSVNSLFEFSRFLTTAFISFGTVYEKDKFIGGPANIGYTYNLNQHASLGFNFTFQNFRKDVYLGINDTKIGETDSYYYTIMPRMDFYWLNNESLKMYSSVMAGGTLLFDNVMYVNGRTAQDDFTFIPGFQMNFFGIQTGKKVFFYMETGIGNLGIVNGGIRAAF